MPKKIIYTDKAPKAIGPYSQAVMAGEMLFISGQIPIDPATGALVPGGAQEQTRQALKNLESILGESGFEAADIVKTTVFLWDLKDFDTVNRLYSEFFKGFYPARSCVQVSALPKGALVEIEAIAVK
jgi:2-iminobutanoate/2-iminopropanoate deaminase